MRKYLFSGLVGLILLVIAACGGDDSTVAPTTAPIVAPTAASESLLQAYADAHAGGPGSIFVGDISQLVGPAIPTDLGDFDGNVPLYALESHLYIYESDYYQGLLEKANFTNPTPLVCTGQSITIQDACINRTLSLSA